MRGFMFLTAMLAVAVASFVVVVDSAQAGCGGGGGGFNSFNSFSTGYGVSYGVVNQVPVYQAPAFFAAPVYQQQAVFAAPAYSYGGYGNVQQNVVFRQRSFAPNPRFVPQQRFRQRTVVRGQGGGVAVGAAVGVGY